MGGRHIEVGEHWRRAEAFGDDFNGSPCMVLPLRTGPSGYVRIAVKGRQEQAHRAIYQWVLGPLSQEVQLDHLCRFPACVNPWHMDPVSPRLNTLRGVGPSAQNARKAVCVHGHPLFGENLRVKMEDGTPRRACRACERRESRERQRARYHSAPAWRERLLERQRKARELGVIQ